MMVMVVASVGTASTSNVSGSSIGSGRESCVGVFGLICFVRVSLEAESTGQIHPLLPGRGEEEKAKGREEGKTSRRGHTGVSFQKPDHDGYHTTGIPCYVICCQVHPLRSPREGGREGERVRERVKERERMRERMRERVRDPPTWSPLFLTHSLYHSLPRSPSLNRSLPLSLTHSITHSFAHSLPPSLTRFLPLSIHPNTQSLTPFPLPPPLPRSPSRSWPCERRTRALHPLLGARRGSNPPASSL